MPTYDYVCADCGNRFELFQSMKDDPLKDCPKCKGHLKRLIGTGAGIIFKGKGFYQTDYKSACPAGGEKPSSCEGSCGCPNKDSSD
ncbi:MAG: zinc ribbon domain-containing protein [Candidatus Omnitrophica bacterium]|nr:zinc ribbon domain-containing protein [Candidatus Omnitrophota bacterium]